MAALHFHDFTTTGKFRQGSNEDHWNRWINASFPIVPILTHYAILYLPLSLPNLSKALTPSSFFLLVATPPTLWVALYFLFIFCCLQLVPHLVILKHHSLYHSLKSSLIFLASIITPCPGDCAKTQGMFVPVSLLFSCADMTGAHPETVPAGQSCDTVSLTLNPLLLQTFLSFSIFELLAAAAGYFVL